jgi:hypothetical protein
VFLRLYKYSEVNFKWRIRPTSGACSHSRQHAPRPQTASHHESARITIPLCPRHLARKAPAADANLGVTWPGRSSNLTTSGAAHLLLYHRDCRLPTIAVSLSTTPANTLDGAIMRRYAKGRRVPPCFSLHLAGRYFIHLSSNPSDDRLRPPETLASYRVPLSTWHKRSLRSVESGGRGCGGDGGAPKLT